MQVKGAGIKPLKEFVLDNYKEEGYLKWINSLAPEVQLIYKNPILPSVWFPLKKYGIDAENRIIELFLGGDHKKARDIGRYVADKGLNGVYRFLVKVGTPHFIIEKASTVMSTYFDPSEIEVEKIDSNNYFFRILVFPEISDTMEYHIAGWAQKALEISGCKDVDVEITKAMSRGDASTEYKVSWN